MSNDLFVVLKIFEKEKLPNPGRLAEGTAETLKQRQKSRSLCRKQPVKCWRRCAVGKRFRFFSGTGKYSATLGEFSILADWFFGRLSLFRFSSVFDALTNARKNSLPAKKNPAKLPGSGIANFAKAHRPKPIRLFDGV